jgi:hypothetical protein
MSNNQFTGIQYDTSNVGSLNTGLLVDACNYDSEGGVPVYQGGGVSSINSINRLSLLNLNLRKQLATNNPVEQLVSVNGLLVEVSQ